VIVQAPADAAVFVDGVRVPSAAGARTLVTPQLEPARDYYYTLRAEATRNGKLVTRSQRVVVRAGKQVRVNFGELASTSSTDGSAPSHLRVHVPEDARLFVDGIAVPLTGSVRSFDTPELATGSSYYYTLRVELPRDGQLRSDIRRVSIQAGQMVDVHFNDNQPAIRTASR
jgi:uncharacterized protein (TIGR03000 family)